MQKGKTVLKWLLNDPLIQRSYCIRVLGFEVVMLEDVLTMEKRGTSACSLSCQERVR